MINRVEMSSICIKYFIIIPGVLLFSFSLLSPCVVFGASGASYLEGKTAGYILGSGNIVGLAKPEVDKSSPQFW